MIPTLTTPQIEVEYGDIIAAIGLALGIVGIGPVSIISLIRKSNRLKTTLRIENDVANSYLLLVMETKSPKPIIVRSVKFMVDEVEQKRTKRLEDWAWKGNKCEISSDKPLYEPINFSDEFFPNMENKDYKMKVLVYTETRRKPFSSKRYKINPQEDN